MKIKLNKYNGDAVVNTIRQVCLTRLEVTRPIAFKVGQSSTVIGIADSVEEDMTEFISNVSSSNFVLSEGEFAEVTVTCNGTLSANAFSTGAVGVTKTGVDEVLHSLAPISVTVYFRNSYGKYTIDENKDFLEKNGVDISTITVVNSRHCKAVNFTVEKEPQENDMVEYDLAIDPLDPVGSDKLIKEAIQILKDDINAL